MKKVLSLMLSFVILFVSLTIFGGESIKSVKALDNSTLKGTIPYYMKPGTVLVYDENLEPTIVKGGYTTDVKPTVESLDKPWIVETTEDMPKEEIEQLELENKIVEDAYSNGICIKAPEPNIYKGMKVVYDEYTGEINNIYYVDENDPSGYSLHNTPDKDNSFRKDVKKAMQSGKTVRWTWGRHNNTLIYKPGDDSFLGTGRATYFTGSIRE